MVLVWLLLLPGNPFMDIGEKLGHNMSASHNCYLLGYNCLCIFCNHWRYYMAFHLVILMVSE